MITALADSYRTPLLIVCGTHQEAPYLVHSTKDVCVVLLKATDTGKTGESARELVAVQHAKISQTQGQFPPGTRPMIKHQTAAI